MVFVHGLKVYNILLPQLAYKISGSCLRTSELIVLTGGLCYISPSPSQKVIRPSFHWYSQLIMPSLLVKLGEYVKLTTFLKMHRTKEYYSSVMDHICRGKEAWLSWIFFIILDTKMLVTGLFFSDWFRQSRA